VNGAEIVYDQNEDNDDDQLPPGWLRCVTEDGKVYYQNNRTKQTQWNKPNNDQQNNQSPSSIKPKDAQNPSVLYGAELAQLISMGFDDHEKNIKAILRAKGNVQVAVNILVMQ